MNKKMQFIFNGGILACSSLLLRLTGLGFGAYITQHLGAQGMGLISLINTVYGFGITVAVSGIFLACMRLCAAALAENNTFALFTAMQKSFLYAAFFGFLAMGGICTFSNFLGSRFLGDTRTVEAIRILVVALPFIALTTVTDAYFTAVGRVYKSAVSDFAEQFFKITATVLLLKSAEPFGLQASITAVVKGSCIGEIGAFAVSMLLYKHDTKKFRKQSIPCVSKSESLLRIALPIALSTYARSGLVTVEHALIPKGLQAFGNHKEDALADYGIVKGMALPIVLFPASVLSSFTGLLIPEITKDHTKSNRKAIDCKASLSLHLACIFSVMTAVILFIFGNDLGIAVYKNAKAGQFIRCFAPLVPFMYCDTTADSLLKGLDKQVYTMIVNIVDAAVSVLMTMHFVPQFGLMGYIVIVFITEILNFSCSTGKLIQFVSVAFNPIHSLLLPGLITALCALPIRYAFARSSLALSVRCLLEICCSILLCIIPIFHCTGIKEITKDLKPFQNRIPSLKIHPTTP